MSVQAPAWSSMKVAELKSEASRLRLWTKGRWSLFGKRTNLLAALVKNWKAKPSIRYLMSS